MRMRTHPGEVLLEEFLMPNGLSAHGLALAIGVAPSRIAEITKCKRRVSADTAVRLARFFGTSAEFWLNLQNAYDLSLAEIESHDEFQRIVPFSAVEAVF